MIKFSGKGTFTERFFFLIMRFVHETGKTFPHK